MTANIHTESQDNTAASHTEQDERPSLHSWNARAVTGTELGGTVNVRRLLPVSQY